MQALIVWDLNGVLPKRKVSLQEDCAAAEIVRRTTIQILSELVRHGVAPQDLQFEAASKYSTLPELLDQSLQQFDYNRLLSCSSDNHFQGLASRLQDSPIETVVICGTKQPQKYIQQLGNIGKRVWVVGEEQVFSKKAQRFVDQAMPLVNKKELNFPENLPRHKVKEWVSVLWDLENTVFLETDPSQSSITDVQVQARALHQYLKEQGFAIASRWSKASVKHHSYALQQLTFALAPFGIRVEEARHFGEAAEQQLTRLTEKISKHYQFGSESPAHTFLISGDSDLLPAAKRVQRYGSFLEVISYQRNLSERMRTAADKYTFMENLLGEYKANCLTQPS